MTLSLLSQLSSEALRVKLVELEPRPDGGFAERSAFPATDVIGDSSDETYREAES